MPARVRLQPAIEGPNNILRPIIGFYTDYLERSHHGAETDRGGGPVKARVPAAITVRRTLVHESGRSAVSPPAENSSINRGTTSNTSAAMPMPAYPGSTPTIAVPGTMVMMVNVNVALRSCVSPKRPMMVMPPDGRIRKPTPMVPKNASSKLVRFAPGTKARPIVAANTALRVSRRSGTACRAADCVARAAHGLVAAERAGIRALFRRYGRETMTGATVVSSR